MSPKDEDIKQSLELHQSLSQLSEDEFRTYMRVAMANAGGFGYLTHAERKLMVERGYAVREGTGASMDYKLTDTGRKLLDEGLRIAQAQEHRGESPYVQITVDVDTAMKIRLALSFAAQSRPEFESLMDLAKTLDVLIAKAGVG